MVGVGFRANLLRILGIIMVKGSPPVFGLNIIRTQGPWKTTQVTECYPSCLRRPNRSSQFGMFFSSWLREYSRIWGLRKLLTPCLVWGFFEAQPARVENKATPNWFKENTIKHLLNSSTSAVTAAHTARKLRSFHSIPVATMWLGAPTRENGLAVKLLY